MSGETQVEYLVSPLGNVCYAYADEAVGVLSQDSIDKSADVDGLDLAALEADLTGL